MTNLFFSGFTVTTCTLKFGFLNIHQFLSNLRNRILNVGKKLHGKYVKYIYRVVILACFSIYIFIYIFFPGKKSTLYLQKRCKHFQITGQLWG